MWNTVTGDGNCEGYNSTFPEFHRGEQHSGSSSGLVALVVSVDRAVGLGMR